MNRITQDEFNAKCAAADKIEHYESVNTGAYCGVVVILTTGNATEKWFVGMALDDRAMVIETFSLMG